MKQFYFLFFFIINFRTEKANAFTLLIILIVKSHQIELHSKNLLLKVSKSRKQTMMSLILQKNKQNSLKILS